MSVESNGDGSDIFWPGYVDAVTNLVLNLLFLLTIMTVALFIFAMELGKRQASKEGVLISVNSAQEVAVDTPASEKTEDVESLRKQVESLKREIKLSNEARSAQKVVSATERVGKPAKGLEQATSNNDGGIIVQYVDDAVSLTSAETEKLRNTLAPVIASGGARIEVTVPKGFSEAKRLGFYRSMSVRNLLIDMKLPTAQIEVSVKEGPSDSDASIVRVTPRRP